MKIFTQNIECTDIEPLQNIHSKNKYFGKLYKKNGYSEISYFAYSYSSLPVKIIIKPILQNKYSVCYSIENIWIWLVTVGIGIHISIILLFHFVIKNKNMLAIFNEIKYLYLVIIILLPIVFFINILVFIQLAHQDLNRSLNNT